MVLTTIVCGNTEAAQSPKPVLTPLKISPQFLNINTIHHLLLDFPQSPEIFSQIAY